MIFRNLYSKTKSDVIMKRKVSQKLLKWRTLVSIILFFCLTGCEKTLVARRFQAILQSLKKVIREQQILPIN